MKGSRPRSRTAHGLIAAVAAAWAFASAAHAAETPKPLQGPLPTETSCVKCHAELDGELLEPTRHTGDDIHFVKGLSCHDCHGGNPAAGLDGDPSAAHDEKKGWHPRPRRSEIPAFCARCHADAAYMKRFDPHVRIDQLSEYLTSGHGRRLKQGDDRVAVCVDCHGVHGIRAVSDVQSTVHPLHLADTCARCHTNKELMLAFNRPVEPFSDYKKSVHAHALYDGGDLSAPTCNDCHGSHGAAPPGVDSVTSVCGTCHTREATLFRETEAKRRLDLSDCIQCMVCHSNHAVTLPGDELLGVGPQSTCTGCHAEGDKEYVAADRMHQALQRLRGRLAEAHTLLERAGRAGVEVTPDRFALQAAQDQIVEAKVLVHSFDLERFLKVTDEGQKVADAGVEAGHRAFAELKYRRTGLALFLVVVVAVIAALGFKVRQVGRESPS
jgi:hypothetical protein